jgi:hypothetical protein
MGLKYPCHAEGQILAGAKRGNRTPIPIYFLIDLGLEIGHLRLLYLLGQKEIEMTVKMKLIKWNMNYWRMICPLESCGKLSKKFYLAKSDYFGCRRCQKIYDNDQVAFKSVSHLKIKQQMREARRPREFYKAIYLYERLWKACLSPLRQKSVFGASQLSRRFHYPIRPIDKDLINAVKARYLVPSKEERPVPIPVKERLLTASSRS